MRMRIIEAGKIKEEVAKLCMDANYYLGDDIIEALKAAEEISETPKNIINKLLLNAEISKNERVPICQDTGMAVFFVEIGDRIHINGNIEKAITEGVKEGYTKGFLRASVVSDPLRRVNTKDNTPPVIHYEFTEGDRLKITIAPKGFGSENKSAVKMLTPSDGIDGIVNFVKDTVKKAGGSPCPPIVVGIGIGGTMEKAAILAKKALTRNINAPNPDPFYEELENCLLKEINDLNIGPMGLGGKTTALGVNIEVFPTHIAGLPVAVNISCHVTRHKLVSI